MQTIPLWLGEIWVDLGTMRWPMSFSLIMVVLLALWSARQLTGWRTSPDLRTKTLVDAILFWGGFALISGLLGSLVGTIVMFQTIETMGEASAVVVAGGYKVALLSSTLGLLILGFAALAWFALQLRWRLLHAEP